MLHASLANPLIDHRCVRSRHVTPSRCLPHAVMDHQVPINEVGRRRLPRSRWGCVRSAAVHSEVPGLGGVQTEDPSPGPPEAVGETLLWGDPPHSWPEPGAPSRAGTWRGRRIHLDPSGSRWRTHPAPPPTAQGQNPGLRMGGPRMHTGLGRRAAPARAPGLPGEADGARGPTPPSTPSCRTGPWSPPGPQRRRA